MHMYEIRRYICLYVARGPLVYFYFRIDFKIKTTHFSRCSSKLKKFFFALFSFYSLALFLRRNFAAHFVYTILFIYFTVCEFYFAPHTHTPRTEAHTHIRLYAIK